MPGCMIIRGLKRLIRWHLDILASAKDCILWIWVPSAANFWMRQVIWWILKSMRICDTGISLQISWLDINLSLVHGAQMLSNQPCVCNDVRPIVYKPLFARSRSLASRSLTDWTPFLSAQYFKSSSNLYFIIFLQYREYFWNFKCNRSKNRHKTTIRRCSWTRKWSSLVDFRYVKI